MKAMILAAGLGTRLGEITKSVPKCLVEAGGKTILQHVIERLKGAGVTSLIINLCYLKEAVQEYLQEQKNFGIDIQFSEEEILLGTGGGVYNARDFFEKEQDFYIYNADIYSDFDITKLLAKHRSDKNLVTLATTNRQSTRPLLFDSGGNLCGWENANDGVGEVFGNDPEPIALGFNCIQVVSPGIFKYMSEEKVPFSTIRVFLKAARAGERIQSFSTGNAYWIDMGTPSKLQELQDFLKPRADLN